MYLNVSREKRTGFWFGVEVIMEFWSQRKDMIVGVFLEGYNS